ncbi:hypothetical protein L1049_026006 [Liquidambar formosana]|uniref:Histone-lysine N-methyltransferase ASHH2 n=1 Tax=Liquidambar formosana TaxID=63359 RepID=A0AAP0NDZ8_LIQFO
MVEEKSNVDSSSQIWCSQGCEMPLEILHMAGSSSNCAEHDEKKDDNSVNGPSAERAMEVVVEKSDINACSQILPPQGCAMPLEPNNLAGSLNYSAQHNEQKDNNSVYGPSAERVMEFVEENIDVDTCSQMLPLQGCQLTSESSRRTGSLSDKAQQNGQKDTNTLNGHLAERVVELVGEKSDVFVVIGPQMCTHISPIEENACNLRKASSDIAPDYPVEKSVSLQSCQSSSVVYNGPSKSLDVPDIFGMDVASDAVDCSDQMDNERMDKANFDSVSKNKSPDNICLSSRRSTRISKSSQKTQIEKPLKKCRKTANKLPHPHGTVEIPVKVWKRKRSRISKPARSSTWGLLGNVSQVFEQDNWLGVNQVKNQGSRKARGGRGSEKRNKNREGGKGKFHASTSCIRLKVKVRKEENQSSLKVTVPEVVDTSAPAHAVISDYGHGLHRETSSEFSKFANCVEDKLGEEVLGISCINRDLEKVETYPDASNLDACLADKDLESSVIQEKSAGNAADVYCGISPQIEVEALGGAVENRYFDPGTSPDSEVINLIPDVQGSARVQEDLHDPLLTSSKDFVAPGDVTRSTLPQMSRKKGRKKDKLPRAGNFIVDPLTGPASISKPKLLEKCGRRQKTGDGFNSDETFASSTSGNALNNNLSSNGLSRELLPLSKDTELGVFREALTVESGMEANLYFSSDIGLGSSESQNFEKFLPSTRTNGHKLSKSLKSTSKCRSEVHDSLRSSGGNTCRQKGIRRKLVNKSRVKDKGVCDQVCKVESFLETGNHAGDDIGKTITGDITASEDKCNLDMVTSGVVQPYLPQRNAWVRCDDCHKWRRILATLADSIEETNCKWSCKDNMDKAFADCSIPQEKSNAEINAELEISDASCEDDANDDRLNSKGLERRRSTVPQQSSWILIKSNLFLHRSRKTQTIDEIMVCHCKPSRDGRLGCGDECLNRMLNIECVQGTCPCGDQCANQQFQKRKYANLKWFRCGRKGYGLQLLEDISKGQFLIEYVGEVLDLHAYEARQKEYACRGHKHFYFMTLNGSEVIDACAKGNLGRFINHSCDPNCRTEKWMVNGEICIGLFALRNIKKGEEVTFDYNYVRVFGAAAKKCVCGSSQCRGYIGGDPLNTEVIVQGDSDEEYPEPVMVREDGITCESLDNVSTTTSFDGENNRDKIDKSAAAVGQSPIMIENDDSVNRSASAVSHLQISLEMEDSVGKLQPSVQTVDISIQTEDITSKPISAVQQEITMEEETMNKSLCSSSLTTVLSKSSSDTVDVNRKSKPGAVEDDQILLKSHPLMKTSRSSSSVKKGKHKSNLVNANKSQSLSNKPKKLLEGSANGRFEAVQETLNELLDADGGISKRKDAAKGYLKLLLLTAASGDSGNGEAIQSNRDLSMILDALLKTKSRLVLGDIIKKNGLRMLHNIMKQYRTNHNKIPILRKLLKVLEYLAVREILTLEHIHGGPPCLGMESFRESILSLTEHNDKQVHQIARSFRDKWIPRPVRKFNCIERDDGRMDFHRGSNCNRFSASHNYRRDQGVGPTEAIDCIKPSLVATTPVDAGTLGCSAPGIGGSSTNGARTRKRKSRWDQPKEMKPDLLQECESSLQPEIGERVLDHINGVSRKGKIFHAGVWNQPPQETFKMEDDGSQSIHEDAPPGFSSPVNGPLGPFNASSTSVDLPQQNVQHSNSAFEMVTGNPQDRFMSHLPVSYGIPVSIVQQFGTPAESVESWVIAPGMPFHPFPPLPLFPHEKRNPSPSCAVNPVSMNQSGEVQQVSCGSTTHHLDQSTPSTSGASPPDVDVPSANNQHMFKRARDTSCDLGRRYFRQHKWNNTKFVPPWIRKRNGWGFMGNNSRSGMCGIGIGSVENELKSPYCSEDVSSRSESTGNTFYQHPEHQNHL